MPMVAELPEPENKRGILLSVLFIHSRNHGDLVYYTGSESSLPPEECTSTHYPIALAQGMIAIGY